jgi:uncharacterized RDD family membrane protein YckC
MAFDDTKTIITPEQVAITYRLAGIATRFAAMLADSLAQAAVGLLLFLLVPLIGGLPRLARESSPWLIALLVMAVFAVIWGYFIFWEAVWSGRTPGKKLAGIRVVRDSGHPVDFRAVFLRNICRYVDFLPAAYGVGATAMFFSKDSKRLGDYVAGTVVIVDAQAPAPSRGPQPAAPIQYRVLGDPSLLDLSAISREQLAMVDRYLERRETLVGGNRSELARTVGAPLVTAIGLPPPSDSFDYEAFLEEVADLFRRRADK